MVLTDLATVRSLLDRDRDWAAYAIGDLAPGYLEHCEWHAPATGSRALLLLCPCAEGLLGMASGLLGGSDTHR